MKNEENGSYDMKTMVSCTNMLYKLGFQVQFQATIAGLKSLTSKKIYKPEEVKVVNFYRFEGESNPADNAILYAIETVDGEQGTLTDAYGVYGDANVTKFISDVESLEKKVNKDATL